MFRIALAALLGAISLSACAQQPAPAATTAAAAAPGDAAAIEKHVRSALKQLDPNFDPEYVGAAPFGGFREVLVAGQVLYVSDDGRYLLQAQPYDIQAKALVTSQGLLDHRRTLLKTSAHADRIVFAPPNPKYTISVFTDTQCGYCRKLHQDIAELNRNGIAVEYLAFPRMGPGSEDFREMVSVWCADDRKAALTAAKSGKGVPAKTCTSPVAMQYNLGQQLGVNGTPAIFAADGTQLGGYLPPAQLRARLDQIAAAAGSR